MLKFMINMRYFLDIQEMPSLILTNSKVIVFSINVIKVWVNALPERAYSNTKTRLYRQNVMRQAFGYTALFSC